MNKTRAVIAGLMLLAGVFHGGAQAATFEVEPDSDGTYMIQISGDIEEGDDKKFNELAAKYPSAMVFLHSDGGSTLDGIAIGQTIKAKGYSTAIIENLDCVSACGLIWLAGSPRVLTRNGRVGFHASYTDDTGTPLESGVGNALVGRYLTLLNLPEEAVIFTTVASPDELNWLTAENYKEAGIDTKIVDVDASGSDAVDAANGKVMEPQEAEDKGGKRTRKRAENPQESSDDINWWKTVGIWSIGIDKTLDNSCFMLGSFRGGTYFRIGFDASEGPGSSYLLFGNEEWTSLKADEKYELVFTMGKNTPWSVPTTAVDMDGTNMLMGEFSDDTFWDEFVNSENILISHKEKTMANLILEDSAPAFGALTDCQNQQGHKTNRGPNFRKTSLGRPAS